MELMYSKCVSYGSKINFENLFPLPLSLVQGSSSKLLKIEIIAPDSDQKSINRLNYQPLETWMQLCD